MITLYRVPNYLQITQISLSKNFKNLHSILNEKQHCVGEEAGETRNEIIASAYNFILSCETGRADITTTFLQVRTLILPTHSGQPLL